LIQFIILEVYPVYGIMANNSSHNLWIEKGYEIFSEDGLDGLQVERLARILQLNKSGFYHYFGDRDSFIEDLFKYHENYCNLIIEDYKKIQDFDPGFIHITLKFQYAILFHMQLVRYRHIEKFNNFYKHINKDVDKEIVRTFSKFVGLQDNPELAHKFFMHARDMFYSRITKENMNEEFLRSLIYEVRDLVQIFIRQGNTEGKP
jgi:AcrR family transcriptional regulator